MSVLRTNWDTSTNKDVFKTLVDNWFNSTDRAPMVEWTNMFRPKNQGRVRKKGENCWINASTTRSRRREYPYPKTEV